VKSGYLVTTLEAPKSCVRFIRRLILAILVMDKRDPIKTKPDHAVSSRRVLNGENSLSDRDLAPHDLVAGTGQFQLGVFVWAIEDQVHVPLHYPRETSSPRNDNLRSLRRIILCPRFNLESSVSIQFTENLIAVDNNLSALRNGQRVAGFFLIFVVVVQPRSLFFIDILRLNPCLSQFAYVAFAAASAIKLQNTRIDTRAPRMIHAVTKYLHCP